LENYSSETQDTHLEGIIHRGVIRVKRKSLIDGATKSFSNEEKPLFRITLESTFLDW
jgi:hypothetical protein